MTSPNDDAAFWRPSGTLLDDAVPGFQIVKFSQVHGNKNQPLGQYSDVWVGRVRGVGVTFAISQSYPEPHDLCVCYTGNGWSLNERSSQSADDDWTCNQANFIKQDGQFGYLFFSCLDNKLNQVNQDWTGTNRLWNRTKYFDNLQLGDMSSRQFMMLQMWIELDHALTDDERRVLQDTFNACRDIVYRAASAELK
jgi:hypothetical protein